MNADLYRLSVLSVDVAMLLAIAGSVTFGADLWPISFLPEPRMATAFAFHPDPGLLIQLGAGNEHRYAPYASCSEPDNDNPLVVQRRDGFPFRSINRSGCPDRSGRLMLRMNELPPRQRSVRPRSAWTASQCPLGIIHLHPGQKSQHAFGNSRYLRSGRELDDWTAMLPSCPVAQRPILSQNTSLTQLPGAFRRVRRYICVQGRYILGNAPMNIFAWPGP